MRRSIGRSLLAALTGLATIGTLAVTGPGTASAVANALAATGHEGQLKPSGTYVPGNLTTYAELDSVNYRFTLTADDDGQGRMAVVFTQAGNGCTFFDGTFLLGTHDNSNDAVEPVSGDEPVVTLAGPPTIVSGDYVQEINVVFDAAGEATVYYFLTLTDTADDCSGSSQSSQLDNATDTGDFRTIGAQTVPINANGILQRGSITVTKNIDRDGDGMFEDTADAGEFCFTLDAGDCIPTAANGTVVFSGVEDGQHLVSETQFVFSQGTYVFASGSGTNCEFDNGSVASATVQSGVEDPNDNQAEPINASCVFNNEPAPAPEGSSLTIVKETLPAGMGSFDFGTTGDGLDDFTLDFDPNTPATNTVTFSDLAAGDFTVEEENTGGWFVSSLECTGDGTWSVDLNNRRKLNITLAADQDLVCIYQNSLHPWITIVKETSPENQGSFNFTATGPGLSPFTLDFNSPTGNVKAFKGLIPGNYSVTESSTQGWTLANLVCDAGTWQIAENNPRRLNITLAAGDRITCTFTNTQDQGPQRAETSSPQPDKSGNPTVTNQPSTSPASTSQPADGSDPEVLSAGLTAAMGPLAQAPLAAVAPTAEVAPAAEAAPALLAELPRTGAGIMLVTLVGALLMAFGGIARWAGRRWPSGQSV